jgi:hypothetical protein
MMIERTKKMDGISEGGKGRERSLNKKGNKKKRNAFIRRLWMGHLLLVM